MRVKVIFHNRFRKGGASFWGLVKSSQAVSSQYVTDKEKFFLEMYQNYAEPLYRYFVFRIFSVSRAEELLQELFLRFWQVLEKGTPIERQSYLPRREVRHPPELPYRPSAIVFGVQFGQNRFLVFLRCGRLAFQYDLVI